ncbi:zinc finger protein 318 [Arapaima gigas]
MFRGRPQRGYPQGTHDAPSGPSSRGLNVSHSPPGPGSLHHGAYREDRERDQPAYHHGYRRNPDAYRRSPPRTRFPSGGSRRAGEFRGGAPSPRDPVNKGLTPSPPHSGFPLDHSLVITVGNELTGFPYQKHDHSHERDYRFEDPHCHPAFPGKTPGYDLWQDDHVYRRRSRSRGRSRARSRSNSRDRGRSKSRRRSRSRGRSRGTSKTRPQSRSWSRGRSWGQSKNLTRGRSRSRSGSSSSSSSRSSSSRSSSRRIQQRSPSMLPSEDKNSDEFRELELARRRKEVEEMLTMPRKSILKKRVDSETDSPAAVQSTESPAEVTRERQTSSLTRETERFLQVVSKGIESGLFASILGEKREEEHKLSATQSPRLQQYEEMLSRVKTETTCEFLLPHEKVRQDNSGFSRILGLMGDLPGLQEHKKSFTDIEDEERFLYGDEDEEDKDKAKAQTPSQTGATQQHGPSELVQYGDVKSDMSQYRDNREFMLQCLSQDGRTLGLSNKSSLANTFSLNHRDHSCIEGNAEAKLLSTCDQNQVDMKSCHRGQTSTTPEKERKTGMSWSLSEPDCYLPGVGPQDAKERQDVEEYEKIQDLLKTIGLDLGVTEISKMAARTQERLHGKKPPVGSSRHVERHADRRTSSGSWDPCHSRSGSRSRSPSWSRSRRRSSNSDRCSQSPPSSRQPSYGETHMPPGRLEIEREVEEKCWGIPVLGKDASHPPITTAMNPPPNLPSVTQPATPLGPIPCPTVPTYTQNLPPSYPPLAPNYPPPGYGQYGSYMPYMSHRWPMFPPPTLMPPAAPVEDQQMPAAIGRPYLRVIETVALEDQNKGQTTQKSDISQGSKSALKEDRHLARSDPNRHATSGQPPAVSEEKNNASQKQKVSEEREKLRKEQEIRLRKKEYLTKELERLRKQQGIFWILIPVNCVQLAFIDICFICLISQLRKEHETAEKKRVELEKVALILGLHVSEKYRRELALERPGEQARTSKKPASESSSNIPSSKTLSTSRNSPEKQKVKSTAGTLDQYEYYDAGNHWCKNCNITCGSMFDFFTHLHSKSHRKTQDPYDRPWATNFSCSEKKWTDGGKVVKPAKGSEFLIPVKGFYCQLCEEFLGDHICAEDHVKSLCHNEKYKKRIEEFPLYEQRRNLDRQAGLAVVVTDSKDRKHSELKQKLEDNHSHHKEETPQNHKEEKSISHKEERPQKHRDERGHSHKEERPENHRDEKSESQKQNRTGSYRDEKSGSLNDGISQKKEREEEMGESRERVPEKDSKAEASKRAEQTEKLSDFHRVISGPSPSILAKVRRKNEDAIRNSSLFTSSPPAFGKFSWKKVDEEEKAPESIMVEDSGDVHGSGVRDDGKAALVKSKTIAIKLSGKTVIPPPSPWVPSNSQLAAPAKICPNVPAPAMVLRKSGSGPSNKPPPLNTFLSIRPSGNGINKPLPVLKDQNKQDAVVTPDLISKAFCGEEVVLKTEVPDKIIIHGKSKLTQGEEVTVTGEQSPPPPGMCVMTYESDVAAPGVPESEQMMTVVVRPPPMLQKNLTDNPQKTDKPKSSLAAAKAQDLYGIFYGSGASDFRGGTRDLKSGDAKSKEPEVSITTDEFENEAELQRPPESSNEYPNPEVTAAGSKKQAQRVEN